jgi:CubicO group peptidase (beta-lactamase class C family)
MLRMKTRAAGLLMTLMSALLHCSLAAAQTSLPTFPDAKQSDPQANRIMQGFPPPPDKMVRFGDGSASNVAMLPREERDLGTVKFTTMDGAPMNFDEALQKTYADGIVVLHKGKIVYERYFGAGAPHRPHAAFSLTKSFVGTLATMLIIEGKLDPTALVTKYVPELQSSAYGHATVRQAMDMLVNTKYSENWRLDTASPRLYRPAHLL